MFAEGVFEAEFTPSEERDWLDSGHVELEPRRYRVLSENYELPKDNTFVATILVEPEAALIAAGHIERIDEEENESAEPDETEETESDEQPDDELVNEPEEAVADEPVSDKE